MRTNHPQCLAVGIVHTISIGYTVTLLTGARTPAEAAVLAGAAIIFLVPHYLQIRTALRGGQQRGVPVSLIVQTVATYAPIPFLASLWVVLGYSWAMTMPTILSGAVLVRLRPRFAVPIAVAIGAFSFWLGLTPPYGNLTAGLYNLITVVVTGGVTYAAVRLVAVSRELEQARTELAEAAVLRERLRISRDLHDGLGSSLTAVALKGDLARRLVERDPEAARAELAELVQVARDAAQDVRQVARGYREISLAEEVHRAVALLEASGVSCQTNLADLRVSQPVDEALAWAVREGATNVVRHSHATTCSISTSAGAGTVRLELVNDRAGKGAADGNGLTGLRERIGGLGGSVSAGRTGNGGFRLVTEVPA